MNAFPMFEKCARSQGECPFGYVNRYYHPQSVTGHIDLHYHLWADYFGADLKSAAITVKEELWLT